MMGTGRPALEFREDYSSSYVGSENDAETSEKRSQINQFPLSTCWRAPLSSATLASVIAGCDMVVLGIMGWLISLSTCVVQWSAMHTRILAAAIALTVIFAWLRKAYQQATLYYTSGQLRAILPAFVASWMLALSSACVFADPEWLDPNFAGAVAFSGLVSLSAVRFVVAAVMTGFLGQRIAPRTVILSNGLESSHLVARFVACRDPRFRLLGVLDDEPAIGPLPYLGPCEAVFGFIQRGVVDRVLVVKSLFQPEASELLQRLADQAIETLLVTERTRFLLSNDVGVRDLELIHLLWRPIGGWRMFVKAAVDYVLAAIVLCLAIIPMFFIAIAIRVESPGPALFRQRRIGFNNRGFYMLKFRTMYDDTADYNVLRQVRKGDSRVTRIGRLLRMTSLDELPQLLNILKGDMSFVGPRPHAPNTRAGTRLFSEVLPRYDARHRVKPGLTGLAQVRGWRGATEREDQLIGRVKSDLEYIDTWSLWLDIVIVARTVVAICRMRNAY